MRELFIEELQEVQGGHHRPGHGGGHPHCPQFTTLACNEEDPRCVPPCD